MGIPADVVKAFIDDLEIKVIPADSEEETIAFGLHFASVFPSSDILNGYVTNTEANIHVALSSHRNSHLYITFFHVL